MKVELFGMARTLAGRPQVEVAGERATPRELARALATAFPALTGDVIDVESGTFVEPNMLLLDGRRAPAADEAFGAADRPCVLFLASGG